MNEVFFRETQSFRQPFLWISLILLSIFVVVFQVWRIMGANGEIYRWRCWGLFFSVLIIVAVNALLYVSRFDVFVDTEGLSTRFYPIEISYRKTAWDDIASCKIIEIQPMRFGGWGLRRGLKSKAYIISGSKALELHLKNGSILVTGTQEPERLLAAMQSR